MIKQTGGRDALNDFAPKFAEVIDDVLFGEIWSEGRLLVQSSGGRMSRRKYRDRMAGTDYC